MAHVLVIGASKGIGLETTKAALAAGHRVRAFARSAARIGLSEPNLEWFAGDAVDAGDVARPSMGSTSWSRRSGCRAGISSVRRQRL